MAVTINIRSDEGVNLNSGGSSYVASLPLMFNSSKNLGFFRDSLANSPQYGVAQKDDDGDGTFSDGAVMVAGGKLAYSLQTHVVQGKLDTLAFGDGLAGAPASGYLAREVMAPEETVVTFSRLGLDSAKGDKVSDILYGAMTGDEAALVKFLAKTAMKFNGGDGDDSFKGGSKNDVLYGAGGADTLTGGAGKDKFVFKAVEDSAPEAFDTITDFNGKQGDRLNLKAIDADTTRTGNQAFDFIGSADFSGTAGELRFETSGKSYDILGDVDGDGTADFVIQLSKASALAEGHFIL